jgi:hypothetical protein
MKSTLGGCEYYELGLSICAVQISLIWRAVTGRPQKRRAHQFKKSLRGQNRAEVFPEGVLGHSVAAQLMRLASTGSEAAASKEGSLRLTLHVAWG